MYLNPEYINNYINKKTIGNPVKNGLKGNTNGQRT